MVTLHISMNKNLELEVHYGGINMKNEKNWYRCTTREEMVLLVASGFDYTNFRPDKYNNGNNTYFFERTEKLEKFLELWKQQ